MAWALIGVADVPTLVGQHASVAGATPRDPPFQVPEQQANQDRVSPESPWPNQLLTRPELTNYRATSRAADVDRVLNNVAKRCDRIRLTTLGQTVEGRPIRAIVAAHPPAARPSDLKKDDPRLVVLLLGGIHAGECDGKEALLMLLRQLAAEPDHPWWQHFVLLVVPNFNVDGGERIGVEHRPHQDGPEEGSGRRENAQDLDLNRDYMKLESPEVRALVRWARRWDIDVFIDTHTTNGSRHRYPVTFAIPHCPAAPASIVQWMRNDLMPAVQARLDKQQIASQYYGNFNADQTRWVSYGVEPRYGTEYFGVSGCISILVESYSHQPFRDRVRVSGQFVAACLDELAARHQEITQLRSQVRRDVIRAGRRPAASDRVPIAGRLAQWHDKPTITIKGFRTDESGQLKPHDHPVEHWGKGEPVRFVRRPFAYLLPHEASRIADRLVMHGLRLEQLTQSVALDVEQYRIASRQQAGNPYEGHRTVELQVTSHHTQRLLPEGTYVVRMDQPLANLAIWLLEPESQDGLVTWNFYDRYATEPGELLPVERLNDPIPLPTQRVSRVEPAQQLTLDELYDPRKQVRFEWPAPQELRWLPGRDEYLRKYQGHIWRVEAASGAMYPFANVQKVAQALEKLPEFSSADAQRLAGTLGVLSPQADAQILLYQNDLYYVRLDGSTARRLTFDPHPERLVTFSPSGRWVAFVRQHNLFVVSVDDGRSWPLTVDGDENHLYGELDWVYQEEVYGRGNFRGYWWSPDSRRVAILVLDETPVHRYTVTDHIPYRQSHEVTPYPKAGDPLPHARLAIAPVAGGALTWADLDGYLPEDRLIVRVTWHPSSERLLVQVQDRRQTWLDLLTIEPSTGRSQRLLRESSPAWIEPMSEPVWLDDDQFLWLSPRSGNVHLYRARCPGSAAADRAATGGGWQPATDLETALVPLTHGEWEVRQLLGTDPEKRWAFVLATDNQRLQEHLYRVPLEGGPPEQITSPGGSHSVQFSDTKRFYFDRMSSLTQPPSLRVCTVEGTVTHMLAPSSDDPLRYYRLAEPRQANFLSRDGFPLSGRLLVPPDFDASGNRKYPVLCYVYGGPQAPVNMDRWSGSTYLWHQLLAQKGVCVWMADNRAATHRGLHHTWTVHRRLGEQELRDVEDGLEWLKKQPWVDGERLGIWGWSYGGYLAAYALTHSQHFRLGIAGAPVTDWRNYDAIYTERLMGTPQDNPDGYHRSSVVRSAGKLHGHLVLIHGDGDDNVHVANTWQLVEALQQNQKSFSLMIYPRNRHAITQPSQVRHLRTFMTEQVIQWLLTK